GTVLFWGQVPFTAVRQPTPVAGLSEVIAIATGSSPLNGSTIGNHLAVDRSGRAWSWGGPISDTGPAQVIPGLAGTVTAAAGRAYFALTTDGMPSGTLRAWGSNQTGQLGDGTHNDRLTPAPVTLANVAGVATGEWQALAASSEGSVYSWGLRLLPGTPGPTWQQLLTPTRVDGLPAAMAVAAGSEASYAVSGDGSLWAWGGNGYG